MAPRVESNPELLAFGVVLQPGAEALPVGYDDFDLFGIGFAGSLKFVSAVGEKKSSVAKNKEVSGGTAETGQPLETVFFRENVLSQKLVVASDDAGVKFLSRQLLLQFG